jgi:hypothetical protein
MPHRLVRWEVSVGAWANDLPVGLEAAFEHDEGARMGVAVETSLQPLRI